MRAAGSAGKRRMKTIKFAMNDTQHPTTHACVRAQREPDAKSPKPKGVKIRRPPYSKTHLGGLTLGVVEVGGDGDDGVADLGAEEGLGSLLHLGQNERANLRGRVGLALRLNL